MKHLKKIIIIFVLLVSTTSCESYDISEEGIDKTYYQNEIFSTNNIKLYGNWALVQKFGGKMGKEYPLDFKGITFKKYGIFHITRNDSIICSGKVVVNIQNENDLTISFEKKSGEHYLTNDLAQRIVTISEDTLILRDECADCLKYCFVRKD